MRLTLLERDVRELSERGVTVDDALQRGLAALGRRPRLERATAAPGSTEAVEELVHLHAEAAADVRMLRFGYATRSEDYEASRRRYDAVEGYLADLRRHVAPALRAQLRELRAREASLEQELRAHGVDPGTVGPIVPEATSVDPSPRPGEGERRRHALRPLPPRRSARERLEEWWAQRRRRSR